MIRLRLCSLLVVVCYVILAACGRSTSAYQDSPILQVRFDAYHSHTWIESIPQPGINQYHLLSSPSRAAQALVAMGCQVDVQLKPWDEISLRNINLVVLNLVSADRPAFRVSEIEAISDFVQRGGGMILITDHTNCYFHNHALEALCDRLDIKLTSQTACEMPPQTLAQGAGWILVESFRNHPILSNIKNIGIQTGGTVDDRYGIAWTSPASWGDEAHIPMYGEGKDMGFTGNFFQDPSEPSGPLPVVAAKEFGAGRIVVIGDQNAMGGLFLNYADNRRLWLQSALWASKTTVDLEPKIEMGLHTEPDRSLVWCVEPLGDHDFYWGSTDRDDYYYAFALLNKHADARASDSDLMDATWMIIPNGELLEKPQWETKARSFLERPNKHVAIMLSDGHIPSDDQIKVLLDSKEFSVSDSDGFRIYALSNQSTLQLWKQSKRWTNRELLGPEKTRNDADYRREEALLSPMWKLGLKRVRSFEESIDWPEDDKK
ncbi:MAG: hypothetical protein ACOVOJ_16360 [Pirellula sp.]